MPREGPCAVRAVVDGVTKCHDMLGTTKRYFPASDESSYAGLETCDASPVQEGRRREGGQDGRVLEAQASG